MNNSDLLRIFAEANKQVGYDRYAEKLEDKATVEEAEDCLNKGEC